MFLYIDIEDFKQYNTFVCLNNCSFVSWKLLGGQDCYSIVPIFIAFVVSI